MLLVDVLSHHALQEWALLRPMTYRAAWGHKVCQRRQQAFTLMSDLFTQWGQSAKTELTGKFEQRTQSNLNQMQLPTKLSIPFYQWTAYIAQQTCQGIACGQRQALASLICLAMTKLWANQFVDRPKTGWATPGGSKCRYYCYNKHRLCISWSYYAFIHDVTWSTHSRKEEVGN